MIDADEARMRAERRAAEEASRLPTTQVTTTVEPRSTLLPEGERPELVGSTAGRLVDAVRLASAMARRGVSLILRRAAVIGSVVVKAAQPALSSLGAALADEIEMSDAGDLAFAAVTVAVAVGVGVGVAFVA